MRRSFRLSLNSNMAKRSYGMTRRTISATLASNSSSSRVSDVRVATSSRKSSRSLRSRNRTAGLTRGAAMSGFFLRVFRRLLRRFLHDFYARAGADSSRPGGHHGFQIGERTGASRSFHAPGLSHHSPPQRNI